MLLAMKAPSLDHQGIPWCSFFLVNSPKDKLSMSQEAWTHPYSDPSLPQLTRTLAEI